jgi:hypothetical protein
VRLVDFGLARTADLAGLTTRSTVLGTPEYMAPEVISDGHADPRSDVYSLGVVLYEAATGRPPFRGDSPYQLLRQHLTAAPPRPRALAPDLPAEIDDAIARALHKDPLDRFASAADLEAALDEGAPVALAPRPAPSPGQRLVCRHCGGAVVVLARTCVDCGQSSLRVQTERRGRAVLVTGPGDAADKLDGRSHVALVKVLEELPAGTRGLDDLREQPPRLPFYVATDLDHDSASALAGRLGEVGFVARVVPRASLRPREVRAKAWRMARRYVGVTLGISFAVAPQIGRLTGLPFLGLATFGAMVGGSLVISSLLARVPLVRIAAASPGDPAQARLADTLRRLGRRGDRRLVARILDRLPLCARLGAGAAVAPLGERAALAAEGLAALDDVDEPEPRAGGPDARAALDRLREAERLRGVLVADLLRTFSRLDLLCLKLARADALAAQGRASVLASELDDLRTQLAAEDDLAALLGPKP